MTRGPVSIGAWIQRHLREDAPRSRSLIITIFGDSVAPYRGGIWLGDLIDLLRPFGVNERLVRTSVYRLAESGWLTAQRIGRRSYYILAPSGRRRFLQAYKRVYAPPAEWNGEWTLAILPKADTGAVARAGLRRELEWEGFGSPAAGVFLRPGADSAALQTILDEQGMNGRVVVLRTTAPLSGPEPSATSAITTAPTRELVASCWNLAPATAGYTQFIARFSALRDRIAESNTIRPDHAFITQSLMIDAFRRATLHDPRLPASLLPADWPGHVAYRLCSALYRRLYRTTREHLSVTLSADDGTAPASPQALQRRFGGLET